ncbi:MBL fold metallo-hydrolase [Microbulbifer sp. OS29]|uniref:MBL fold metallo-hydrolase n=1 Tax=Microbulbifer okhotskensis TaxID=2926617 RepID=A0A9X2EID6_9GAMM|nr:MBL fold metallo-hydrolase [Microbulbifer okhotskensis]MCO1332797.1 MBL fold metallo-hydrolase [Microbulbifer okhotskensis]
MRPRLDIVATITFGIFLAISSVAEQPESLKRYPPYVEDDGKMHIYFCGTGTPDPAYQYLRHPACIAVRSSGKLFLVDAGEGATARIGQLGLNLAQLDPIFITHWHSDHFGGLAMVINESWFVGADSPINVYGPYGIHRILDGINKSFGPDILFRSANRQGILDPVLAVATPHLVNIAGDQNEVVQNVWHHRDTYVSVFAVHHEPVFPAFGYEIRFGPCKVIITGDTHVFDALEPIEREADLLISEALSYAQYISKLKQTGDNRRARLRYEKAKQIIHYHSNTLDIAKMATKAGVKSVALTHLIPPPVSAEDKTGFIQGMHKFYSGPIRVMDDLDEIVLSDNGQGSCKVEYPTNRIPTNVKGKSEKSDKPQKATSAKAKSTGASKSTQFDKGDQQSD